jgi:hypothetical protein
VSILPFALYPEAAAGWLRQLESMPVKIRAGQLYAALKALYAASLPETTRLLLLETLRPSVFAASEILAKDATYVGAPLAEAARSAAKLSVLLHHELALGYERLLTEATPLAGHRVMASLGWMLVRILQLGEPPAGIFRRLYAAYRQGQAQGWLNHLESEPLNGVVAETPQDRFKCIAAFAALAPTRLDPRLMDELFGFLLRHRQYLALSDAPVTNGWVVDLYQDQGPRGSGFVSEDRVLYLELRLPQTGELPSVLDRRLNHLLGRLPQEEYPLTRRVDELWHGWHSIIAELSRQVSPAANLWLAVPQFELAPLDAYPSVAIPPEFCQIRVYRRLNGLLRCQNEAIAVLEVEPVPIQPGDLLGLKLLDESLLVAVVRWVRVGGGGAKISLGLELIGGQAERVQVLIEGRHLTGIAAVQGKSRILLLSPRRLKPATQLMLNGRETQVLRLVEWAEQFCAYQLID